MNSDISHIASPWSLSLSLSDMVAFNGYIAENIPIVKTYLTKLTVRDFSLSLFASVRLSWRLLVCTIHVR